MAKRKPKGAAKVQKQAQELERLEVEYVSVADIAPNEYNPNRQSTHDFELLIRSMDEDGFTQPIICQKDGRRIVDGEHRWTGAIVHHYLKTNKIDITPGNIADARDRRLEILDGALEIPVVFVDMTEAQRKISTLRHNRARGSEDYDLTAALMKDLEALGALDWAQDSLMMDQVELDALMEQDVPGSLAGEEYSQAWEPSEDGGDHGASTEGREINETTTAASSRRAVEKARETEKKLEEARTEEERAAIQRDNQQYRLYVTFAGDEADLVRHVLGDQPAENALKLIKVELEVLAGKGDKEAKKLLEAASAAAEAGATEEEEPEPVPAG